MQKLPLELIRDFFSFREEKPIDIQEAHRIKKELDFIINYDIKYRSKEEPV